MSYISTELTNYLKQCNLTEQEQEKILDLIDDERRSSIAITPSDLIDLIPYYSEEEAIYVLYQFKQLDGGRFVRDYIERLSRDLKQFIIYKSELSPPEDLVILVEGILKSKFGVDFYHTIFEYELELLVKECWRRDRLFLISLVEFQHNYDITKMPEVINTVAYLYIDRLFKTPEQILIHFSKESETLSDSFQHYFNNYIQERYNYNSTELLKLWTNFDS